ncbi:hypothetical protein VNO80_11937 [Phaseolus coccineus]|uniref:Uncharacterized protein n=1 Tax=Phaseolus coccineus TaxID=3886 RepID=A0AAN9RFY1_PHACN
MVGKGKVEGREKLCRDPMRRKRWKRFKEENRPIVKSLSSSVPATLWSDVSSKRKIPQCPKTSDTLVSREGIP